MKTPYDPLKHQRLFLLGLLSEPKIEISIHVRKHGNCLEIVKLIVYDQKYFMFDSSRDIKEAVMDFQITTKIFLYFFSNIFACYSANVYNFFLLSIVGKLLRNYVLHVATYLEGLKEGSNS